MSDRVFLLGVQSAGGDELYLVAANVSLADRLMGFKTSTINNHLLRTARPVGLSSLGWVPFNDPRVVDKTVYAIPKGQTGASYAHSDADRPLYEAFMAAYIEKAAAEKAAAEAAAEKAAAEKAAAESTSDVIRLGFFTMEKSRML